jgi:hypothetical protein
MGAGAWVGCSSSSNTTTPSKDSGGGGADNYVPGDDSGGNPETGGGGDTGTEAGGLSCASYCTTVMTNCTGGNAQYLSQEQCEAMCAVWPVGVETDTSGDTLGCRNTHAGYAATPGPATTHCPHAGPYGGGVCGTTCANFCELALARCSAAALLADAGIDGSPTGTFLGVPFTDNTDCTTKCGAWTFPSTNDPDAGYNASGGPQSGNVGECREWHLANAWRAGQQDPHCGHIDDIAGGPCQ